MNFDIGFLTTVFSREGNPIELVSDNGVQFTSYEFQTFLKERGIRHTKSSLYFPRANGAIERFNRVLNETVQTAKLMGVEQIKFVKDFLLDFRNTKSAITDLSPSELLHGRSMRTKLEIGHEKIDQDMIEALPAKIAENQQKVKAYVDQKKGGRFEQRLRVGDLVRIRKPWHVPKGDQKYTQPYRNVQQKRSNTYLLENGKIWNAEFLSRSCRDTEGGDDGDMNVPEPEIDVPPEDSEPRRSTRVRERPVWLRDYD